MTDFVWVADEQYGSDIEDLLRGYYIWISSELQISTLRLDSASFMKEAHALYGGVGFYEIGPYPECELPAELAEQWIFMELKLH